MLVAGPRLCLEEEEEDSSEPEAAGPRLCVDEEVDESSEPDAKGWLVGQTMPGTLRWAVLSAVRRLSTAEDVAGWMQSLAMAAAAASEVYSLRCLSLRILISSFAAAMMDVASW